MKLLSPVWHFPDCFLKTLRLCRKYGFLASTHLFLARLLFWSRQPCDNFDTAFLRSVRLRCCQFPIYYRLFSSDLFVIDQIFGGEEYSQAKKLLPPPKIIVDCGANIGCASVYFLDIFPGARVISIEPDPDNCRILTLNLRPYHERATVIPAAVWHSHAPVYRDKKPFRDNLHWARRFSEEKNDHDEPVPTITLSDILNVLDNEQIDFLKIDIEGAEAFLFQYEPERWLSHVRMLAVELHSDAAYSAFAKATATLTGRAWRTGEITWWENQGISAA